MVPPTIHWVWRCVLLTETALWLHIQTKASLEATVCTTQVIHSLCSSRPDPLTETHALSVRFLHCCSHISYSLLHGPLFRGCGPRLWILVCFRGLLVILLVIHPEEPLVRVSRASSVPTCSPSSHHTTTTAGGTCAVRPYTRTGSRTGCSRRADSGGRGRYPYLPLAILVSVISRGRSNRSRSRRP